MTIHSLKRKRYVKQAILGTEENSWKLLVYLLLVICSVVE